MKASVRIRLQGGPFDGHRQALRQAVKQPPLKIWVENCDAHQDCRCHIFAEQTRKGELYRRDEELKGFWIYVFTDTRLGGPERDERELVGAGAGQSERPA